MEPLNENEVVVSMTFSLSIKQVTEIGELKGRFGMNASAVVRMAIDNLYDENGDKDTSHE